MRRIAQIDIPSEIDEVEIDPSSPYGGPLTPERLRAYLASARPLDTDPMTDGWQYTLWYSGRFVAGGVRYQFTLNHGGRGVLRRGDGSYGYFEFEP